MPRSGAEAPFPSKSLASFAGAVVIATPWVTRASNSAGDCGGFFLTPGVKKLSDDENCYFDQPQACLGSDVSLELAAMEVGGGSEQANVTCRVKVESRPDGSVLSTFRAGVSRIL